MFFAATYSVLHEAVDLRRLEQGVRERDLEAAKAYFKAITRQGPSRLHAVLGLGLPIARRGMVDMWAAAALSTGGPGLLASQIVAMRRAISHGSSTSQWVENTVASQMESAYEDITPDYASGLIDDPEELVEVVEAETTDLLIQAIQGWVDGTTFDMERLDDFMEELVDTLSAGDIRWSEPAGASYGSWILEAGTRALEIGYDDTAQVDWWGWVVTARDRFDPTAGARSDGLYGWDAAVETINRFIVSNS